MATKSDRQTDTPLRARSRVIELLGDQLIGDAQLAVFELVKNAYDADASFARVTLEGLGTQDPQIIVEDDGEGMDANTVNNVWLVIGHDIRKKQRERGKRSSKYNRLPLGEKGVGRIATHKLGQKIELHTRRSRKSEVEVLVDWGEVLKNEFLDEAVVRVRELSTPELFKGSATGTRIVISDLRQRDWSGRDVRRLYRYITTICSPFEAVGDFAAELKVPGFEEWLADLPTVGELTEEAPWTFRFEFDGTQFHWQYQFNSPKGIKLEGRQAKSEDNDPLLLPPEPGSKGKVIADTDIIEGIGPITGQFFAYDREPRILRLYPQINLRKKFLDEQSGIRVYRDGVRVYNYGEPGDDWLSLDLRRVNRPTERLSRNIVIGAVHIGLLHSTGLREKTNREGFDRNDAFERFRKFVVASLNKFEFERAQDKSRLRRFLDQEKDQVRAPVEEPLKQLRKKIADTAYEAELKPLIEKAENDYHQMRDLMLRAGMAGLNLAVVIHEVERGIRALYEAIRDQTDPEKLLEQARQLVRTFETIAGLLRRSRSEETDVRALVQTAAEINERRLKRHQIKVEYQLARDSDSPLLVRAPFDLLLGTITNLVDNAIYWLRVRYPETEEQKAPIRRMYIGITDELSDGWALVIADNGVGFKDDPELLIEPFFTRKPEGMGLGLYYANIAMQVCGGRLEFPAADDLELPAWVDGGIIALHFLDSK